HSSSSCFDRPSMQLRIVIADEDREAVSRAATELRNAGHQTRGIHHGLDVVAAVGSFSADVLLVDVGMPGVTGYEIARRLRHRYGSAAPLLIATSTPSHPSARRFAQPAGFDHHLSKPYDPQALPGLLAALTGSGSDRVGRSKASQPVSNVKGE